MTEENEQRMERLFHDHYEQMYRFAFALLHDNEEARDVVSDGRLPWIASTMTRPTRQLPSSDCAIGKECRILIIR